MENFLNSAKWPLPTAFSWFRDITKQFTCHHLSLYSVNTACNCTVDLTPQLLKRLYLFFFCFLKQCFKSAWSERSNPKSIIKDYQTRLHCTAICLFKTEFAKALIKFSHQLGDDNVIIKDALEAFYIFQKLSFKCQVCFDHSAVISLKWPLGYGQNFVFTFSYFQILIYSFYLVRAVYIQSDDSAQGHLLWILLILINKIKWRS